MLSEREKRRAKRIGQMQVKTMHLHSDANHAFHTELSTEESWELLSKISQEAWQIETGEKAPLHLDRSVVNIMKRDGDVSYR